MDIDPQTLLILLTVGILIVGCVGAYLAYRQWRKGKDNQRVTSNANARSEAQAQALANARIDIHTPPAVIVPIPAAPAQAPVAENLSKRETRKPRRPKKAGTKQQVFFDDTVEIEEGGYESVYEDFEAGEEIKGIATERDSDPFNVYVMDEENYAHFCNGDDFKVEFEDEEIGSSHIDVRLPHADTYYVVFDASDWRTPRDLTVRLKRISER